MSYGDIAVRRGLLMLGALAVVFQLSAAASDIRPADSGDKDYLLPPSKDQEMLDLWSKQSRAMRMIELRDICFRTSGRLGAYAAKLLDSDPDEEMKVEAAATLGICGDEKAAIAALRRASQVGSEPVRAAAAASLLKRKDYELALAAYLDLVDHGSWVQAWDAARQLYQFKPSTGLHERFLAKLQQIKGNAKEKTWRRAIVALGVASANISDFDQTTSDLVSKSLSDISSNPDPNEEKQAERLLQWVDGFQRNRNPDAGVRGRMAEAIKPALASKSAKVKQQAKNVSANLSK